MTYEPPVTDYDYIVENCTCAFCGCNCDDLDYLVTEYGIAELRGTTIKERVYKLIEIAHPKFRDELLIKAKELGLIY